MTNPVSQNKEVYALSLDFPNEVLTQIFGYFSQTSELCQCRLVNKQFSQIGYDLLKKKLTTLSVSSAKELNDSFIYFPALTLTAPVKDMSPFTKLTNLTQLSINSKHIKISENITLLTKLRKLFLTNTHTLEFKLASFWKLTSLDLSHLISPKESELTFLDYLSDLRNYTAPIIKKFDLEQAHLSSLLNLSSCVINNLDDKNFDQLSRMTKLTTLELRLFSLNEENLKKLASLKSLKKLVIKKGEQLTGDAFSHLSVFSKLLFFSFKDSTALTESSLFYITKRIKTLEISNCVLLGSEGKDIFGHFSNLEVCTLKDCPSLNFINSFSINRCTKLMALECENVTKNFYPNCEQLASLTNLRRLKLPNFDRSINYANFSALSKLDYLNLSSDKLNINDLQFVKSFRNLTVAKFGNMKIEGDLNWFQGLISLEHLNFEHTNIGPSQLGQFLPTLVNLKILNLSDNDFSELKSLKPLKNLTNLIYLNLSNCRIRKKSLSYLQDLTKLQTLILDTNLKIYRYHSVFAKFKKLEKLTLRGNAVNLFHVFYLKVIAKKVGQLPETCLISL